MMVAHCERDSGGSSVRLPASLLRYPIDSEDREWLSSHKLLSSSSPHLYLIPVEDVRELAVQDEYRSNAVLKELKGFHIPELMLIKVQNYMTELRKSLTSGSAEVQDLGRLNLTSESASPGSFSNLLESSSTGHHEATSPDHEDTGVNSNHSMSSPGHSMSSPGHSMSSPGHSMSSWTEAGPCNSTLAESHSTLTALLSTQTTLTSQ
ncbi:hypothetical protein M8J76_014790 [Diaphorina citri]|nr:hypothetical protein M8J76_014790 [Diaphorina citri]